VEDREREPDVAKVARAVGEGAAAGGAGGALGGDAEARVEDAVGGGLAVRDLRKKLKKKGFSVFLVEVRVFIIVFFFSLPLSLPLCLFPFPPSEYSRCRVASRRPGAPRCARSRPGTSGRSGFVCCFIFLMSVLRSRGRG
jgi:hypothetical protein